MTNEEKKELEQLFCNASKSFSLLKDKLETHCEKDEDGDPNWEKLEGDDDEEVGDAVLRIEAAFEIIWDREDEFFNTEEA